MMVVLVQYVSCIQYVRSKKTKREDTQRAGHSFVSSLLSSPRSRKKGVLSASVFPSLFPSLFHFFVHSLSIYVVVGKLLLLVRDKYERRKRREVVAPEPGENLLLSWNRRQTFCLLNLCLESLSFQLQTLFCCQSRWEGNGTEKRANLVCLLEKKWRQKHKTRHTDCIISSLEQNTDRQAGMKRK